MPRGDSREEDQDLWFDFDGHGTAVTSIVGGSGTSKPVNAGMAPLVQDIRFAKALGSTGAASALGGYAPWTGSRSPPPAATTSRASR